MKLIFRGAPGAGKGTQANRFCEKTESPHISTGDLFREAVRNGTKIGKEVRKFIDAGKFVPDSIVLKIIREHLERMDMEKGFVLDGVPRTVEQAKTLDAILEELDTALDAAVKFELRDDVVVERLSSRRSCRDCGALYHMKFMPPKQDAICDACGGELFQRSDDSPDTIKVRLAEYHAKSAPIDAYYEKTGRLIRIDAEPDPDTVAAAVMEATKSFPS